MSAVCIIPARGGSKRIPRKNIRPFLGRPILAYSIEAALASNCFDEVMVSTDDPEIEAIACECGATVPFAREARTTGDYAGFDEVVHEVLTRYRAQGRDFAQACALFATAPLVTSVHLTLGGEMLRADSRLTAVLPVLRFSFPVQRALALRDGRAPMLHPEHYHTRSQDLEPAYHDAGQWYWLNVDKFLPTRELMGANSAALVLSAMEAQDIDNEDDWALAELKFQLRQHTTLHEHR